jgi:hypothetical protein
LSALCKVVAPAQVQVTYSASNPLPFRVEWCSELGPISFAGSSPDEAAERALSSLRGRMLPELGSFNARAEAPASFCSRVEPPTSTSTAAKMLVRSSGPGASAPVSEPLAQAGWVEAMNERIQAIEEGKPIRRAKLHLVRS